MAMAQWRGPGGRSISGDADGPTAGQSTEQAMGSSLPARNLVWIVHAMAGRLMSSFPAIICTREQLHDCDRVTCRAEDKAFRKPSLSADSGRTEAARCSIVAAMPFAREVDPQSERSVRSLHDRQSEPAFSVGALGLCDVWRQARAACRGWE